MKARVTGAPGFVGGTVVRAVVQNGLGVLARAEADLQNIQHLPIERVEGDLRDQASLRDALAGCRQLYHVAAHYALWAKDPSIFYDINVTGTKNLLETARDVDDKRIVPCSTISAIGLPPGRRTRHETDTRLARPNGRPLQTVEVPGRARGLYACDIRVAGRHRESERPGRRRRRKADPTGQVTVDFMKGRMPAYIETGMNIVDIDDVAAGHLLAMEKGRTGERYLLGNTHLVLREVVEILSRLTGIKAPTIKVPRLAILPLAYPNQWIANLTSQSPRIPLEGVKMAKYKMPYDCSKTIKELSIPHTPPEVALGKAVRRFGDHKYA